jgi:hypothetical protein
VRVFQRGKPVEWREHEDPHEVAEKLQVPLPKPPTEVEETYSAARIEGPSIATVKKALKEYLEGEFEGGGPSPFHVESIDGAVLVWGDDGDIGFAASEAANALPKATVYELHRWVHLGRMVVTVYAGGVETGVFDLPPADRDEDEEEERPPVLSDVKGARTPETIADALGIPRKHLGLA